MRISPSKCTKLQRFALYFQRFFVGDSPEPHSWGTVPASDSLLCVRPPSHYFRVSAPLDQTSLRWPWLWPLKLKTGLPRLLPLWGLTFTPKLVWFFNASLFPGWEVVRNS